ncbi:DUF3379 domain-containing protein [Vibrio paucivorans]|uniref:DUF3379 domain-containing protein n=1 Tax=Vibrio paucivorans TaxID=2829489 RepID=A0A9X3HQ41_9VIBR|nr:DUF3379 domain-containing protein [Vibrio paucivorans]MCW8333043.1 DUF3379 domain-containing protein [Vibrio paucivorans]
MDELEFRRRIMSDPKQRDAEIADALNNNEANSKFLDDVLELDAQLAKAMNVDVPDDLADKILFNQPIEKDNVVRPNFAKRAMALAASVAFAFGLLVGQLNWGNLLVPPAQASLVDTAMKHVLDEKSFIEPLDEQVSSRQINAKMAPFAYQFDENFPYHVYYLNHCGFGDSNAMHMVFQGEKGKVTLFLTKVGSEDTKNFYQQGMSGIVEPIGNTSLILVGEDGENVAKIAEKLAPMIIPAS